MKAQILALAFACSLVGCGETPKPEVVGQWKTDTGYMEAKMRSAIAEPTKNVGATPDPERIALYLSMQVEMEFARAGTYKTRVKVGPNWLAEKGTWTKLRGTASKVAVELVSEGQTNELSWTFIDKDTVELNLPSKMYGPPGFWNGPKPPMRFQRVSTTTDEPTAPSVLSETGRLEAQQDPRTLVIVFFGALQAQDLPSITNLMAPKRLEALQRSGRFEAWLDVWSQVRDQKVGAVLDRADANGRYPDTVRVRVDYSTHGPDNVTVTRLGERWYWDEL